MEQSKYKEYRIMQYIFNVPLTLMIFSIVAFIITLPIALLTNTNFDRALEPVGWIVLGAMLGWIILIIPSVLAGLWISRQVEKLKLCRNKEDIRQSLIITVKLYAWVTVLPSIMLIFSSHNLKSSFLILIYGLIIVFSACLTSLILSYFLPHRNT